MAKYENPAELDYRNGGDTVDDFAQKYMRTVDYIIKALNDLRTPTGNTAGVEPEPYMWRIADNKLYIRNADNTDYILLGDISPNFGFRQSVNDRFITTADLEREGTVVVRDANNKVTGDITGSPDKIAGKLVEVTPTSTNDILAYDATQQAWVKKTLNDYLKKTDDPEYDDLVAEIVDQVITDITPVIFNYWRPDAGGYLTPLGSNVIAPQYGSTQNSVGAQDRPWHEGHFDSVKLNGGDLGEYLAESTGYGIVSGCEPTISGLTVTVGAGIVHLADGTRKEISATNITLDNADSTNPRIDLVYIDSTGTIAKITGTAAASPVVPTLPTGGISVCNVTIAAGASTGTVNRVQTIAPNLAIYGVVNVKDFGAVGDGVTDDTAAIQSAIDNGKNIFIPVGTYVISQKLNISARTILRGESNSKLLFSSVVGLELNGSFIKIERLILECTRSRNDNTLAITDNGNRVASCELKDLEFYQWTTGIDLYGGYNDKIIIDSMYFNTVNNCIKVAHGDGGLIKNIVAEPFINYVIALHSCNAIEVSNVLATGVGTDNGYISNPSVVFIVLSNNGASKYDGINVNIHDVYCEKVNTISISNTSFLIISNVFCNNNYSLKDVFKICKPYGGMPVGNINLINIECSAYTGVGIWSPSAAYSETVGDVVITSSLGRPPINVITSSILSYNSISGYEAPRFDCDNIKTYGKGGGIYPDFNNDLATPPDKSAFSDGDIKFNPSFTNNVNSFSNIVGHIKNSLADNDGWSPIQIGLPTFGKYYLRDTLKGSFAGQLVYNKTDKTLAFWNGEKWCNLSFTILQ